MIHVIATIRTAPGRRDDLLAAFRRAGAPRAGRGRLHRVRTGGRSGRRRSAAQPARDDVVTVVEKWESVAALQAHLAAPHMLRHRERVKDIVVGVEIRVLEPAVNVRPASRWLAATDQA